MSELARKDGVGRGALNTLTEGRLPATDCVSAREGISLGVDGTQPDRTR